MSSLSDLSNSSRGRTKRTRVGRGNGSKGKTCGRGHKGDGSRAGYKRRLGYEGGQIRLHMRLPSRGFSNAQFRKEWEIVNLGEIETHFNDGDEVNIETLVDKGIVCRNEGRIKLLAEGDITKKVTIRLPAISAGAQEKLQNANISFTVDS